MACIYLCKRCTKCGRILPLIGFNKDSQGKLKRKSYCRKCSNQYGKEYREKNKDKRREYDKKYRMSPRGQVVTFNKHHKRKLRKENQGSGITKEQWVEMMEFFDWKCAYSELTLDKNKNRTIDHIIPLSKNGDHEIWNLVPMCSNYNFQKQDKDMLEWYQEQEFYSEERLMKIIEWTIYAYDKWGKNDETA